VKTKKNIKSIGASPDCANLPPKFRAMRKKGGGKSGRKSGGKI